MLLPTTGLIAGVAHSAAEAPLEFTDQGLFD